ncbi:hypothetical protein B0J14DRAFT_671264 [Halenospora varia]|nr:hypothetical protein B0J14DRAFT_671264 [Halenospora varia]
MASDDQAVISQSCIVCDGPSSKLCGRCGDATYCTPECQRTGWKTQKLICSILHEFAERPTPLHRRTLLLPAGATKPKFIWIQYKVLLDGREVPMDPIIQELLGGGKAWRGNVLCLATTGNEEGIKNFKSSILDHDTEKSESLDHQSDDKNTASTTQSNITAEANGILGQRTAKNPAGYSGYSAYFKDFDSADLRNFVDSFAFCTMKM